MIGMLGYLVWRGQGWDMEAWILSGASHVIMRLVHEWSGSCYQTIEV